MTNEEAAKCVEYIRFYMEGGECWTDAEFEAMDMAIEALRTATDINVATKEPKIIRCRDCKHNSAPITAGNALCDLFYGMNDQFGFCYMGVRRDDGSD